MMHPRADERDRATSRETTWLFSI